MYLRCFLIFCCLLSLTCTSQLIQFYPDDYYPEDSVYQNRILKFLITYDNNWHLFTDPVVMDKDSRKFAADLQKSGIELLYIGASSEKYLGTRAIAVNLNEPAEDYAGYIRKLNRNGVEKDQGLFEFTNGRVEMVKWVYEKSGYSFVEFFFNVQTFDIRIAFWTRTEFFNNFLPVFESIISTLTITEW